MAARTYGDVWRSVSLQVPAAPVTLIQKWVQQAYEQLVGRRHWVWLRRDAILATLAQRTVSVTFTNNSTAITSTAGFVVATDPGRQLRVGNGFIYTIASVSTTSAAVLTQAYQGPSGAAAALIHDRYLVMPADFRSFYSVVNPQVPGLPVVWWIGQDQLDLVDPQRSQSDSYLRVLASAKVSLVPATLGRVLYEAWPSPSAASQYPLTYFARVDQLADDDLLQGVLATQTLALEQGALAHAARWPGTEQRKNPYFNLALATQLSKDFDIAVKALDLQDDDQYLQDLQQVDLTTYGLGGDTHTLRATDATLSDYY